jgi:hypothetical protein
MLTLDDRFEEIVADAMPEAMAAFMGSDFVSPAGYLHSTIFTILGPVLFVAGIFTVFAMGQFEEQIELLPLLAEDQLEMVFPEATLRGLADFGAWYGRVTGIFFDEKHELKDVTAHLTDDGANVSVVVYWEASVWNAPEPRSQRIKLHAYQTWFVKRSILTGQPVIARYTVDRLEYSPGSARL